jgi:hypothetical protein
MTKIMMENQETLKMSLDINPLHSYANLLIIARILLFFLFSLALNKIVLRPPQKPVHIVIVILGLYQPT